METSKGNFEWKCRVGIVNFQNRLATEQHKLEIVRYSNIQSSKIQTLSPELY